MNATTLPEDDALAQLRLCALGCGEPVVAGSMYCSDCGPWLEQEGAEHDARAERRRKRDEAQAARARHLAELAERGCGCPSEAECRLRAPDWPPPMPKSRERAFFREAYAGCMRIQRQERERAEEWARREGEAKARREQEWAAVRARYDALKVVMAPSPLLVALRRTVLAARDDRCPKWRFRLASDLVVQIQPRPGERRDRYRLFEVIAIQGEVAKDHFARRHGRPAPWVEFGILAEGDAWRTDPHGYSRDAPALMARLVELLPRLETISPDQMFSPNCLCCGRDLTDPVSQARLVGPECSGLELARGRPGHAVRRHPRPAAAEARSESSPRPSGRLTICRNCWAPVQVDAPCCPCCSNSRMRHPDSTTEPIESGGEQL